MAFSLHRIENGNDWNKVSPELYNFWQKKAAASHGIIAPANFVTIFGAILTIIGLIELTSSSPSLSSALILIFVGRLCDIADGFVADITGTKSSFGEFMDVTVDKILLLIALVLLSAAELLPGLMIIAFLLHGIWNTSISSIARFRGKPIHPSRAGKLATFAIWPIIIFYPLYSLKFAEDIMQDIILIACWLLFIMFLLTAVISGYEYYADLRSIAKKTGKNNAS